jgi:hypothetical protein
LSLSAQDTLSKMVRTEPPKALRLRVPAWPRKPILLLGTLMMSVCLFNPPEIHAQEWSCTAPQDQGGIRYQCDSGNGCWALAWGTGRAQGGCIKGRDVALFMPVSGEFKNIPLREALVILTRGRNLEVKVLGDASKPVSLAFNERPLQLVLQDLQRTSGVPLETAWLPQIKPGEQFSICINARASEAAMLIFAVTGDAVEIPAGKKDVRVNFKLKTVTARQVAEEFQKALQ